MNIYIPEIKEKYPKAFSVFFKIFNGSFIEEYNDKEYLDMVLINIDYDLCYCDFEKFFDDNEIRIDIIFNQFNNFVVTISYYTKQIAEYVYVGFPPGCKNRQEAKEQAVYKAFEILENQLNDK